MNRKFGPRAADSPHQKPCAACGKPFQEGDFTTIVAVGPGDDPEQRQRRDEGRPYNSVAVEVHWDCSPYRSEEEA